MDEYGGRSCYIDQGVYGHRAKKATWLYAVLGSYPEMNWTRASGLERLEPGFPSKEAAKAARSNPSWKAAPMLSKKERIHTPLQFRDALIELVRNNATGPSLRQAKLEA